MIIEYIEIQSFGKLNNYKLTPSNTLNTFCQNNGYGKTTICDFIIAMLYGLNKKTKNDFSREHYLSFKTNFSSGILEVNHNNITYKIVRTFGKTSSLDELYFYENNILNNKVLIPGEYILGINKDSFIRTIYFDSTNLDISSNEDINSKLNHYIENTKLDFNLNDILLKIENAKKEIIPLKLQDEKGTLANSKNKIKTLQNSIIIKQTLNESLKYNEDSLNKLNTNLERLKKEYTNAGNINERLSNIDKYKSDLLKLKSYQDEIDYIYKKYNGNILDENEVNDFFKLYNNKEELLKKLNNNHLSKIEEDKYKEYSLIFNDDSPEEFDIINSKYIEYQKLKSNNIIVNYDLINKYKHSNFNLNLDEASKLNDEYLNLEDSISNDINSNNITKKSYTNILMLISIILFILGIILGSALNFNYYIFILIGLIVMFIGIYLQLNNKIELNNKASNDKYQNFKIQYDNIKNKINNLLSNYGFSTVIYNTPSNTILNAKEEYNKYLDEFNKLEILNKNNLLINELKNEIKILYRKYNIFEEDFNINYNTLLQKFSSYKILKDKITNIDLINTSLNEQINIINNKLNNYLIKYNITDIDIFIKEVKEDIIKYNMKIEDSNKLSNEIENLKIKYNITDNDSNIKYVNIESLSNDISLTTSNINRITDEINNINLSLEQLNYIEDDLEQEKLNFKILERKHYILSLTKDKLLLSNDNLNNKYLNYISDKFNNYLNIINDISGYKFVITKDLNVCIDDNGILRSYKYLSLGEKTLLTLCYRLALLDNIFKDNYFIIIDDLFVNLDSNNLQLALRIIKELSKSRQILYFTCHNTRII